MLPLLLATLFITPTITFTSDSVYTDENVLTLEIQNVYEEDEIVSQNLIMTPRTLLGYEIYDDKETPYIDGILFDNSTVYDWTIENFDGSVEHIISVKTVYTNDVAGMLAAAKNGNWAIALSNPLVLLQLFYYILAAISLILGGFGLAKAKKQKVKTAEDIATAVEEKATASLEVIENNVTEYVTTTLAPVLVNMESRIHAIIEALILAQSNDPNAKLAIVNLLKNVSVESLEEISNTITKAIKEAKKVKDSAKKEATKLVTEIAKGDILKDIDNGTGGIAI